MGYGGSRADAGQAVGKAGDEGIDSVVSEDRLGLDIVYLQAKRWDGTVGRPEIQKFVGALHGKRAKKGVFITTGSFSADAVAYVEHIDPKVVLVDGRRLAEFMIDFEVGVTRPVPVGEARRFRLLRGGLNCRTSRRSADCRSWTSPHRSGRTGSPEASARPSLQSVVGETTYEIWLEMLRILVPGARTHRLAPMLAGMLDTRSSSRRGRAGALDRRVRSWKLSSRWTKVMTMPSSSSQLPFSDYFATLACGPRARAETASRTASSMRRFTSSNGGATCRGNEDRRRYTRRSNFRMQPTARRFARCVG